MNTANITGIQHVGLPVKDLEKTIAFYESLGFTVAHKTVTPDGVTPVAFLQLGSCMIESYQEGTPVGHAGAIDHISMDVTDIEAVYAEVKAGSYKILHDSIQFLPFWENGVRFFTIEGPDAEKIEFCQKL